MHGTRIIPLNGRRLSRPNRRIAEAAFCESGRCWSHVVAAHVEARTGPERKWLKKSDLEAMTKGGLFALHSQTVQALCARLMDAIDTARTNRAQGNRKARYPYKPKNRMPVEWSNQGPRYDAAARRLVLPMGRGNPSLVIKRIDLAPEELDHGVEMVWRDGGIELHVGAARPVAENAGAGRATVDLGEIHQAAVVTSDGASLVVSGRGIRTLKRKHCQQIEEIAKLQKRCTVGSRRHQALQAARERQSLRFDRRVDHLRNRGVKAVVEFCAEHGVKEIRVGNPDGVRKGTCGRKHNRRMALWEYGEDLRLLEDKSKRAGMGFGKGSERGSSSHCPRCGSRHKPKGRQWHCPKCGFQGHRDLVGAHNMHPMFFPNDPKPTFPRKTTYLRADSFGRPSG